MSTSTDPNKQDPDSLQAVGARYGPPSEEAGGCEMCDAKGPVWIAEEEITWNQIPLCAKCFSAAPRPNEKLTPEQIAAIIEAVKPHRIDAEAVLRVADNNWLAHHPVDSAILRELDKIREGK